MCRSIKQLHNLSPDATSEEIRAAATQYARKVSGFTKPSRVNEPAFAAAVDEIAAVTERLLSALEAGAAPRTREELAERARARGAARQG